MRVKLEMERCDGINRTVNHWIEVNQDGIVDQLEAHRKILFQVLSPRDLVRTEKRNLSEMPLCGAAGEIRRCIGLPGSYYPIGGYVTAENGDLWNKTSPKAAHTFIQDRYGNIIDFTLAQYIDAPDEPGAKEQRLLTAAPELTKRYPSGLVVLTGHKLDIVRSLGLEYVSE